MKTILKVATFQWDVDWLDKVKNLAKVTEAITQCSDCDLLILPEMFNTAWTMKPETAAEQLDNSETINQIAKKLQDTDLAVCGTIPTVDHGKYYNTFVMIDKSGLIAHYHKVHLFAPAGEALRYTSGTASKIIKLKGIAIKPMICYDLRFPYLSFQLKQDHYDVLLYSANWPAARIYQWQQLLIARAIENQSYVIGVNRTGKDQNKLEYPGQSMIVSHDGEVISVMGAKEALTTHFLDIEQLNGYRRKLPFLNDAKDSLLF